MSKAVIVKDVRKRYKLYKKSSERILDLVMPWKEYGEDFYALNGVSLEVNHGEIVGFIGINGSGKSTLSNIIAGIIPPTSGEVIANGSISLIAVNAGLDNNLTGRQNIELKLLMLGFSKAEIDAMEEEIIEFAEIEKFIDQPVKSYSSGMKSRLGFSISVRVDPDILIVDEALSVGDKAFAEKSLAKMMEFKERGKTMFFVSHSAGQMRKFCDRIVWLEFGTIRENGETEEVLKHYDEFMKDYQKMSKKERNRYRETVLGKRMKSSGKPETAAH
ncbi:MULTISPECIES: teichoic acids export ABC transporter ATP-binding subunit TagH [Bhargavaea]|uniref:Teichoic acids export ABC transporter ATP-binding subunit TagH n=1 Tax=Bhargavaea changchunensis TaxID=2134037 RepID=A0ABW2NGQ1_9BACL|nr:teichoic acids export ABC transporter ATP-binding subunit TagH [Bhargavaea sp. CC-171006]